MRVLGIETSCDETAVAVVSEGEGGFVIEQNLLASQAALHARFGGVVPEVAAREHAALLFPLIAQAVTDLSQIDAIAVTYGPGLIPALRIGVEAAKALAWASGKPLVAVNHLEGHIYSVGLHSKFEIRNSKFPILCLLVSGGHTELILMRDHGQYEMLGATRDDAAGEAFDKVAKLLGLAYPGGPSIAKAAVSGNPSAIDFPRPMIDSGDLDFSFAGLKTAVRVYLEGRKEEKTRNDVAASFQQAVVDVLVAKTLKAVEATVPTSAILAGGVAANTNLRATLSTALLRSCATPLFAPDLSFTGDNAAMIAAAGIMRARRGEFADPLTLTADANAAL